MTMPIRIIRDLQTRLGHLLEAKYNVQRFFRRWRRVPFETEFEILKHLNPNGRCAIDVGANRGQSIDAVRLYHRDIKILSFEPNRGLFDKLVLRFKNDKKLKLRNMGLGNDEISADLFVPFYRKFMYDGLASFSKDRAANWLNKDTVWNFNPKLVNVVRQTCTIGILDKFGFTPFFLKVHVQGFELEVLKGGEKTIGSHLPVILLAYNEDADIWLREQGWERYNYIDNKLSQASDNTTNLYNCLYFHTRSKEHIHLINTLN